MKIRWSVRPAFLVVIALAGCDATPKPVEQVPAIAQPPPSVPSVEQVCQHISEIFAKSVRERFNQMLPDSIKAAQFDDCVQQITVRRTPATEADYARAAACVLRASGDDAIEECSKGTVFRW